LQTFKDQIAAEDAKRRQDQERAEKEAADEAKRRADELKRAADEAERALGALTINITNTSADPQSVVRAIEQARRMFGDRWLRG
jgi:membrane protein involved in colicin uptake